jgi:hypothetical protein
LVVVVDADDVINIHFYQVSNEVIECLMHVTHKNKAWRHSKRDHLLL